MIHSSIINCTIVNNRAMSHGGISIGIGYNSLVIYNCILWGNVTIETIEEPSQIDGTPHVVYSCIQDKDANDLSVPFDASNIDEDPLFIDADGPDDDPRSWMDNNYHLSSLSPCIDRGGPSCIPALHKLDIYGGPRVLGGRIDIGADEYNPPALEDIYTDRVINLRDYALLAAKWLYSDCNPPNWCEGADIDRDHNVDSVDLTGLAENWLYDIIVPSDMVFIPGGAEGKVRGLRTVPDAM